MLILARSAAFADATCVELEPSSICLAPRTGDTSCVAHLRCLGPVGAGPDLDFEAA